MYVARSELSDAYPTDLPAWEDLAKHFDAQTKKLQIRDLFVQDGQRFENYSLQAGDLFLDYSKNLLTEKTLSLLVKLADEAAVPDVVEAMFAGKKINNTEDRPVLHAALRAKVVKMVFRAATIDAIQDIANAEQGLQQDPATIGQWAEWDYVS